MRIETSAQDDFSSFRQYVLAYESTVFTFCYRMLGNAEVAESIAVEAFLDMHSRFPGVTHLDVLASARRRCCQQLQHRGRLIETMDFDIQNLFNALAVREREVMTLHYACKLNLAEIATILDTPCAAVRDILRQGRWHATRLGQVKGHCLESRPKEKPAEQTTSGSVIESSLAGQYDRRLTTK
jgi:DNA-directed RNA polymerase specialized sigma24 family protein